MRRNGVRFIFLDRDGVINKHPGEDYFVRSKGAFQILPGVTTAVRDLKAAGYGIWVLSNQSGVSTGMIRREDLEEITRVMKAEFKKNDADLDGVLYCSHSDEDQCECRKPKTGLYLQVSRYAPTDFYSSYAIGDSERDLAAGRAVGCKTILVLTGRSNIKDAEKFDVQPDVIKPDLKSAAEWILVQEKS